MISVVINADTRPGWQSDVFTTGDFTQGNGLHGCRSVDFLTHGVRNKMDYFRGYPTQCILCIDEHERVPDDLRWEINDLVQSYGNGSLCVIGPHERSQKRWYDHITIAALRMARGDYVVHFDTDACAYRTDGAPIISDYLKWLDRDEFRFICQPSCLYAAEHQMYWASTRFFICKREALRLDKIEYYLHNARLYADHPWAERVSPPPCCLEHTLGILAGEGGVLYPERQDDDYLIFNWARYHAGTLEKLNAMPYEGVRRYVIEECGMHGANDVLGKVIE